MGRSMEEDPLTLAMSPPPNETPEERQAREAREAEAQRISDEIDEQIRKEKEARRKKKRPVKVLLLGQSESGKTATLKNFQLTYSKREFAEERDSWRAVIQLNLVRNVNAILDALTQEMSASSVSTPVSPNDSDDDSIDDHTHIATVPKAAPAKAGPKLKFGEKHRVLKLRLSPLQRIQKELEKRLGAGSLEPDSTDVTSAAPFELPASRKRALQEFSINSNNGWKSALLRTVRPARPESDQTKKKDTEDEITEVIASCREDMKAIWEDPVVRELLNRRKARIEDSPGFFLNDAERVAVRSYQPTDDDVIRARLRTLGVQEYRFVFDHGRTVGQTWHMFDVGGTRSSRAAWYPYFDDVDAIIFLAPISCFDEKLAEDRHVNRLEDSYLLWRSVCSTKLLSRTQIILFLNKCDLLQAKLMRGVRIRDHVPSFGERRNDLPTATRYFQQHFKEISRQFSPVPRPFYVHLTSVIDIKSTAATLGAVEESILRDHLRRADLIT
ncbi:hypothetical protein PTI98_011907 [Pleurotus ostreatus]|nr:hypothetical protein PTI98_011907 [Pleurotus ostreatus]